MKKLYYLADVLTLCEVIAGVILLGMTCFHAPADYAIWVFVAGELCDAFDGICARHWPYPNDGKKRWWRTYVTQIEHLSDIFIAIACMLYLIFSTDTNTANLALMLGCTLATACIAVELTIKFASTASTSTKVQKAILWLIRIRRWCYAFGGIGGGIYLLIMATTWTTIIKFSAICASLGIGLALLIIKLDRALNP